MPDYNFLNLSPPEFENLSRDLLQKKLEITLESFTGGRDTGIDLRYSRNKGREIIVQCKRYESFSSLLKNLIKEREKVDKLNPKRYILTTSVGLTPSNKQKILELFSPFIISSGDIYGRNDLNNLLTIWPVVEKQHFKLWLSSTGILEKIVHSKIFNQSAFEEEEIKETIRLYVDNESFFKANEILQKRRCLIISGIPGIGKTTLGRVLVYDYLGRGYEEFIFLSNSIGEGYQLYKEGVKQIFLFDDFLGKNFLENKLILNEDRSIIKFMEKVSKSNDKIIIFTTREYILSQAKQKYDSFESTTIDFAKCVIDLSDYTNLVRARILYNHLYFSRLPEVYIQDLLQEGNYLSIIEHPNYNPRIIETMLKQDFWSSIAPKDFTKKFKSFLSNPIHIWKHVYEYQVSELSRCIMSILLTCGVPISINDLQLAVQNFAKFHATKYGFQFSEITFKKSLKELENTFIKINEKENILLIEYQNPSVQDFLVNFHKETPDLINDIFEAAVFFNQFFTIFSFEDLSKTNERKITVKSLHISTIKCKLLTDYDKLLVSSLTGYLTVRKDLPSEYIKLDTLRQCFSLDDFPDLKDFVLERFKRLALPSFVQGFETSSYFNLLKKFSRYIDNDPVTLFKAYVKQMISIEEAKMFNQFEDIYTEAYDEFLSNEEFFWKKLDDLIEGEMKDIEHDSVEDLIDQLQSVEHIFGIDTMTSIKKLEQKFGDWPSSYINDSEDYDFTKRKESQDEMKAIKNMFDGFSYDSRKI